MPFTPSDLLRRYGIAVLAVAMAVGLRLLLDPLLGDTYAFTTLYIAVVFVAWGCGFGPALLTILLGAASATYFVLPPRGSFTIHRLEDLIGLVLFVFFGVVTAALGEQVRRGRGRIDRERGRLKTEVEERTRAEQNLRFLAEAGEVLSSSLDYEATLSAVARLVVPRLADWCTVHLSGDEGRPRQLTVAHVDPAKVEWARDLNHRYPPDPDAATGVPEVLRSGRPYVVPEITEDMILAGTRDSAHLEIIRSLGLKSLMVVPMNARDRTVGAITLVAAESGRLYGPDDLALAEELAGRAAQAVDNARLYHESQEALRLRDETVVRLRRTEEQLTFLVRASGTLTRTPEGPTVVAAILDLSRRLLPADAHAVWRRREATGRWEIAASQGLSEKYRLHKIEFMQSAAGMTDAPVIADDVERAPAVADRLSLYRSEGIRSLMAMPLRILGRNSGSLTLYHRTPHAFDDGEVRVATALANLAAAALTAADLYDEQRRLHAEAREQRELFRVTLASIGDAVVATDAAARVTFVNEAAAALTGWAPEEAHGRSLEEVFRILNEDTRAPAENPATRALRDGQVIGLANHTVLLARDGRELPIDDSAAPIRDAEGNIHGVVLVFRDVAERRAAEAALRESEERFRTLADSMPQLAWMARADGHLIWYNRRWYEYTGTTPEQMEGWGWQSVHDAGELPRVIENWKAALASGEAWEDTFPLRRHDGAMRWHLSRAEPVRDERGRVTRWFGTNTDITDRMEMESALREASRRKDEFLAMLGHELRNPLAPLRNALQILRMRPGGDPAVEQMREMMERQVAQMVRLVEDLLDVSRIASGKIDLRKEPVDLAALVARVTEGMRPVVEEKRHRLEAELAPGPMPVNADPARLEQLLANLLSNASKYTPPGGLIGVALRREGRDAMLSVRDTGIGIRADMLPRIFDMFQQADRVAGRVSEGLGLGLTLVRSLAEMHGGGVTARSDGPGRGSEFVVRLPLATEGAEAPPASAETKAAGDGRPLRVLVVDDNVDGAQSMAMLLRLAGHEVRAEHDGPAALDAARAWPPDVVLLDIGLPKGMDGYEVARRLRSECGLREAFLAAVTGYGQEDDRRRAREAGFDAHVTKPVDMDGLRKLLARAGAGRVS